MGGWERTSPPRHGVFDLSFLVFFLSFWVNLPCFILKSSDFENILANFSKLICFENIRQKSATLWNTLGFEEKFSVILVFSWVLQTVGKVLPTVKFFTWFFAWILFLIFSFFWWAVLKKPLSTFSKRCIFNIPMSTWFLSLFSRCDLPGWERLKKRQQCSNYFGQRRSI